MPKTHLFALFAVALTACAPTVMTTQATVRPASQPRNVLVSENNARLSISCEGGDMTISGNRNFVTFTGVCDDIIVTGNNNTVTADSVRRVTVRGNSNRVTWGGNDPVVSNTGNSNTVRRR